ncbi:neck protein [Vibrio phage 1.054.O._10N.261.52.A1]|nr:neck protein [Vibrio phage 1.054.O._10N.261.52.A1]
MSVTVSGGTKIASRIAELKRKFREAPTVLIGVPKAEGNYEDGTHIATVAAAQEFGANINHPGGTPYGYATEKDASNGRVRFLKKGQGYAVLGETSAHNISIPERSFLRSGVADSEKGIKKIYENMMPKVVDGSMDIDTMQKLVGELCVGNIVSKIESGIGPPNASSTVRKKGSSNTLIDSGTLRQSITYVIAPTGENIEEGL